MYRTGGHGALTLWFNVKLSPPNGLTLYEKWFNTIREFSKWFNVKLSAREGLISNQFVS